MRTTFFLATMTTLPRVLTGDLDQVPSGANNVRSGRSTNLASGVTDEVVILISTITGPCGHAPFSGTNGLLVDDLRVE